MKRTFKSLIVMAGLAIAAITGSLIATPAQAQTATCIDYNGNLVYPGTATGPSRFKVCFPVAQPVDTARRNSIFNAIQALPRKNVNAVPLEVRDVLEVRAVTYHYFYDRNYYNSYVQTTYPSIPSFVDNSARCGTTHTNSDGSIIISAIFEVCELSPTNRIINPNLVRTTLHETGHAFDFANAETYGSNATANRGRSVAWKKLMKHDLEQLTPALWDDPDEYDAFRKQNVLCGIFGSIALSSLEINFGGTPAGAVCNTSGVLDAFYTNKNPRQVYEMKLPYFVANTNGQPTDQSAMDLWAQLFVIKHASIDQTQVNFLKQTDKALGYGSYNTSTAAFRCTKIAMQYYYTDPGINPPSSAFAGTGCPAVTW